MVQINTYFDNENSSSIKFEVLTKGLDHLYPTYTICFEDSVANDKHTMYKTRYIDTLIREDERQSGGNIWQANNETREKFADEFCPDICSVRMEGNKMRYYNDTTNTTAKDENRCRFHAAFERSLDDYAEYEFIHSAFLIQEDEKWYAIHPRQYPFALMGINDSVDFRVDCRKNIFDGWSFGAFKVQYPWEDLLDLDFDERLAMDMRHVLLDYEIRNLSGSRLGWFNDQYKDSKTGCFYEFAYQNTYDGSDEGKADYIKTHCKTPMAWREKFEKRIDTTYPFEKVYQDPKKVCFSPKQDSRIFREHDTIRLNPIEMFNNWYDSRDQFADVLSIYVHPQGQFLRNLHTVAGRHYAAKIFKECSCCKYTEEDIPYWYRLPSELDDFGTENDNLDCSCSRKEVFPVERENCRTTIYNYEIYQITVLNDRPDSNEVCDPDLVNEDIKIMEAVIDHIGCFPSFWEKLVKPRTKYEKCTELSQYKNLAMMTNDFTRFDNFTSNYTKPCQAMTMVFNEVARPGENSGLQVRNIWDAEAQLSDDKWTRIANGPASKMCIKDEQYTWENGTMRFDTECLWEIGDSAGDEGLYGENPRDRWHNPHHGNKFIQKKYQDKFFGPYLDIEFTISTGGTYQVIGNSRAFSVENCWSGIGGFVGIFVGLSLMAVPDLIKDFYDFLRTKVFNK